MKKILLAIIVFLAVFILSLWIYLPVEAIVKSAIADVSRNSGLDFSYETGRFKPSGIELDNLNISRNSAPFFHLDEVSIKPGLGILKIRAKKGEGTASVTLSKGNTTAMFKNFQVVEEGTKYFKKIFLNGTVMYNMKKKSGKGKLKLNLMDSLDTSLVNSDIIANLTLNLKPGDLKIAIDNLQGVNIRGDGQIDMKINGNDFGASPISGNLKIKNPRMPITLNLSGSVGNIQAVPQIGGQN